jgi:hypothetical protein
MKKLFNSPIFHIILTAFFTYLVTSAINKKQNNDENRPRKLDQTSTVRHYDYKELEKNKWQIYFNNTPVHSYNDINVSLFNYDDKNFGDVPVSISIAPQEGDTLRLMNITINGEKDGIQRMKDDTLSQSKGELKFHYIIHTVNQTNNYNKPFFDVNIQAISAKTPQNPVIKIDYKGIDSDLENRTPETFRSKSGSFNPDTLNFIEFLCFLIPCAIIIGVICAKIASLVYSKTYERKDRKRIEEAINEVKEKINIDSINPNDVEMIMKEFARIRYSKVYYDSSKFSRWVNCMRKPDEPDTKE